MPAAAVAMRVELLRRLAVGTHNLGFVEDLARDAAKKTRAERVWSGKCGGGGRGGTGTPTPCSAREVEACDTNMTARLRLHAAAAFGQHQLSCPQPPHRPVSIRTCSRAAASKCPTTLASGLPYSTPWSGQASSPQISGAPRTFPTSARTKNPTSHPAAYGGSARGTLARRTLPTQTCLAQQNPQLPCALPRFRTGPARTVRGSRRQK